ncbi:hypothetical protein Tco_1035507 [Tanacetum coccineum]
MSGTNNEETIQDEKEPKDYDNDIRDLDDYLVQKDAPYYANEEEEQYKERRNLTIALRLTWSLLQNFGIILSGSSYTLVLKNFTQERIEKTKRSKNSQKPTRNERDKTRVKKQPKIKAGSADTARKAVKGPRNKAKDLL